RSRWHGLADILVEMLVLGNNAARVEALFRGGAGSAGEAGMQFGVFEQRGRARSLGGDVADGLEETVLAMGDELGQAAGRGGDGRNRAGHGFERDQPEG